ncbi:hypothetical protein BJX99DRAFT_255292 [Aspergillus californicus]
METVSLVTEMYGGEKRAKFPPEQEPDKGLAAFHAMQIKETVFHNWYTDPWANGGTAWWAPQDMAKYQHEVQRRHEEVFFAFGTRRMNGGLPSTGRWNRVPFVS